jgi:PEP-CTERM motif
MRNAFELCQRILPLAFAASCVSPLASNAATIDLTGRGWVTYGDGNSYALNVGSNPITVMSGPGQISLYTKLGLNPAGQLNNGLSGMDDAFQTPTANNVDSFRMSSTNEPGGSTAQGSWDWVGWWDSTLSALNTNINLSQNSVVFFFANNETGGGTSPDLAAWARLELTQISTGTVLGTFDLTNDLTHQGLVGYGPPPTGGGVPLGNPAAYTSNGAEPFVSDFVDSGSDVCTDAGGNLVSCSSSTVANTYHENLGGDRAAYAIVFPELDQLIEGLVTGGANLGDYALHVEYRLGCGPELTQSGGSFPTTTQGQNTVCDDHYALNGGDEKVFLGTRLLPGVTPPLPEPSTVFLVGLGLAGLAMSRRRNA